MMLGYPTRFEGLGSGEEVSINTLKKMEKIIRESTTNPMVLSTAREIIKNVPWKNEQEEAAAIYGWVQERIRYVKDPYGTEMLVTPPTILDMIAKGQKPQVDCDDFSMLLGSLYRAIGLPVSLRVASYNPNRIFGHVYNLVKIRGTWIPVDGIKENGFIGWEAPNYTNLADYIIDR